MRLSISNTTATKVISVTNVAPAKPYLNINGYYVPVTTATIAGTKVKIQSGTVTYRACEYQSGYYNTTSAAVGNLSSTTALTRVSTSGTTYLTRLSTSGTNYGTRASTSGTSYATRASTSGTTYLTRLSTSGTSYATRASTSGTTYLTRLSTSGTNYGTRASTSATLFTSSTHSAFNAEFQKFQVISSNHGGKKTFTYTYGVYASLTGATGPGYVASEARGTIDGPSVRANYVKFKLTQNVNTNSIIFSIVNGARQTASGYTSAVTANLPNVLSSFITAAPQVAIHSNGEMVYATSSTHKILPWVTSTSNMKYYTYTNSDKLTLGQISVGVSCVQSRWSTQLLIGGRYTSMSMTNYTYTSFFYQERLVPTYATRASTSGTTYLTRLSTSGTNYGTRASTSATIYLTRLSTSGTNYGTRASTSATIYLTRASTSGTTYLTRLFYFRN